MTHIGDGKVRFVAEAKAEGNNNTGDTIIGEAMILDGNWHNVRFVYYKNGTDSVLAIYVDDVLVGVEAGIYYFMQSAVTQSSPITSVDWRVKPYESSDATEATYYFDNISFTYAGPIPEVIPELAN